MKKVVKEGLTFDDVLLVPQESDVLPEDVDISTNLTKDIILKAPIISSAMDTVTESKMAIALARQGGIGIIHRNMSIEDQATEVDRVKRSEYGVITDPFFLGPNNYLYEADELMERYRISGVPITEAGKLIGIITNRDLRFETDHRKKIYEVMTRENLITVPVGTTVEEAKEILTKYKIEKLPIVDDNGDLKGLITIKDIEKTIKYPNSAKDSQGRLLVGAAVGDSFDIFDRIEALIDAKVDIICIDSMHGHFKNFLHTIKKIKTTFPNLPIMAGDVVTANGARAIIEAGADCIKVGMGAGSVCTTRIVSGVGVAQFTAINDCFNVAREYNIPIISDGGIKFSGDITKAIGAGANAVVIGSLFVGSDESPSEIQLYQGRKYKLYRGIRTLIDDDKNLHSHNLKKDVKKFILDGVEGRIGYNGPVKDVILQLIWGLKAGMSYCGARNVNELIETAEFMKISEAVLRESHPHDISITKESPNYSVEY